jgi:hypothetical protein
MPLDVVHKIGKIFARVVTTSRQVIALDLTSMRTCWKSPTSPRPQGPLGLQSQFPEVLCWAVLRPPASTRFRRHPVFCVARITPQPPGKTVSEPLVRFLAHNVIQVLSQQSENRLNQTISEEKRQ